MKNWITRNAIWFMPTVLLIGGILDIGALCAYSYFGFWWIIILGGIGITLITFSFIGIQVLINKVD